MVTSKRKLQDAVAATGVGSTFVVSGYCYVVFQITGTFVGTVTFQSTIDGTNWIATRALNMNSGVTATTGTIEGLFQMGVAGLGIVRANVTAYTSGNITVWIRGTDRG